MILRITYTILFWLIFNPMVFSQSSRIQIGTQIPLNYSLGYEYQPNEKFSFNVQGGILTKPYDVTILEILKALGTKNAIIFAIKKSFNFGYVFQPTFKYHFSDYYIGAAYSFYSLYSNNVEASDLYRRFNMISIDLFNSNLIKLKSNLSNAGIVFGRDFELKDPSWKITLEGSIQKTFYSKSKLYSDIGVVTSLSDKVSDELNIYYIEYGYLPSINIFISKSF